MRNIIFFDLDGTLIKTRSGNKFPKDAKDWQLNTNLLYGFNSLLKKHIDSLEQTYVIVTNQGGIESGFVAENEWIDKMCDIMDALKGFPIFTFYYSKTNNKKDFERKPNAGMAFQAASDFSLSTLKTSVMIGDASGKPHQHSDSDLEFARNAGIGFYYDVEDLENGKLINLLDNVPPSKKTEI